MKLFNRRSNNGSNATENNITQSGWVAISTGASGNVSTTVTFPVAFSSNPLIYASYGGDTATATSTYGSGAINVKRAVGYAITPSTTTMTVGAYTTDGTAWASPNTVYVHWWAYGPA
jgi:hypothetical protein